MSGARAALAACGLLAVTCAPARPAWTPRPLPALDETGLPALPERSARNANYTIEARLDPDTHTLEGSLVLEWRNLTERSVTAFPFHLYWNAFRNNLSTAARGERRREPPPAYTAAEAERRFGFIQVRAVRFGESATDITPTLRYVQPDDGNADDRTVMEVSAPQAVGPGQTARFQIEWSAQIPHGDAGRAGWVHDYHFIVQWFPKLGVLTPQGWNCHQFHANTEFFSDYGVYDVRLTLPLGFVVGATGRQVGDLFRNPDGSVTHHYVQEDVHDFAWTASRRFLERRARFDDSGYPPVDLRLLVQPEHAHQAERYLEATRVALRSYGAWGAPYPYRQITVVDPAWNSASGGMEYPTLFTGGSHVWSPPETHSPEGVTVHEAGHQFWYGLVGNNEFEEAWLDEGFNSYHTSKALDYALGPKTWSKRYFGYTTGKRTRSGVPLLAPRVLVGRGEEDLPDLREHGTTDVMARRGFDYRTADSYTLNSYGKPELTLQTLEGLLGDDVMTRVMRTYARRFRFAHPTTADFIATVNEVTGQDWTWFFDETFFSSGLLDYAVQAKVTPVRVPVGFSDGANGTELPARVPARAAAAPSAWDSEVSVLRLGTVRMPVEVLVRFDDGATRLERWDGRERWTRWHYSGAARVERVVLDPGRKLALDIDPSNNAWMQETGAARRAASKGAARYLFWLQNLLELHALLG